MSVSESQYGHSVFYGLSSTLFLFHNLQTKGDRKKRTSDSESASVITL